MLRSLSRWVWPLTLVMVLSSACGGDDETLDPITAGGSGGEGGTAGGSGGEDCEIDYEPAADIVITDRGAIQGIADGNTMAFLGIPYAAPPVGPLRFRPPSAHACWTDLKGATSFGPVCPQHEDFTQHSGFHGSEDCLTLNVWTPEASAESTARPVMFFIHGGGNIQGSSAELLYDVVPLFTGRHLAEEHDVVVVTVNYRLGPLGFLALPELVEESEHQVAGNYGILDLLQALEWVQTNIRSLGGDPDNVMVFGESAGAVNTCTLMASPLSEGLMHRALMQSGACFQPDLATAIADMSGRVDDSACGAQTDRLACLRSLSAQELLDELPGSIYIGQVQVSDKSESYGPVVDGWTLLGSPDQVISAGQHTPIPFVIGSNAEELALAMQVTVETEQEYVDVIQGAFGFLGQFWVDAILAEYPVSSYLTPQHALIDVYTDATFTCNARYVARSAAAHSSSVYRYWFRRQAETPQQILPAFHGVELIYVFGSIDDIPLYVPAPEDVEITDALMGYWANFARTGDPNSTGSFTWPAYDADTDSHLVIDSPISSGTDLKTSQCDMWADLAQAMAQ